MAGAMQRAIADYEAHTSTCLEMRKLLLEAQPELRETMFACALNEAKYPPGQKVTDVSRYSLWSFGYDSDEIDCVASKVQVYENYEIGKGKCVKLKSNKILLPGDVVPTPAVEILLDSDVRSGAPHQTLLTPEEVRSVHPASAAAAAAAAGPELAVASVPDAPAGLLCVSFFPHLRLAPLYSDEIEEDQPCDAHVVARAAAHQD
jgi:hypothetical protein